MVNRSFTQVKPPLIRDPASKGFEDRPVNCFALP